MKNGLIINLHFNDFLADGKHGYNQEIAVRKVLSMYYDPNKELFHSPFKTNDEELTDFLLAYKKAIVLIESKYSISKKSTKFNDAIVKASSQLRKAEDIICTDISQIKDSKIRSQIINHQILIKICLFNDDGRDLEKAFKNIKSTSVPGELPVFISVSVFKQFLAFVAIKNPDNYKFLIIKNLLAVRETFKDKDVIILSKFDTSDGRIELAM